MEAARRERGEGAYRGPRVEIREQELGNSSASVTNKSPHSMIGTDGSIHL